MASLYDPQVLFNKVNHHNTSVRQDALLGLRDIFQSHADVVPKHLPKLVEQVFITTVDGSSAVRQAAHLLMDTLLSSVSSDVIAPFFGTLIAHLNCGLSHIKETIQLDSLRILELYLKHCSCLLRAYIGELVVVLIGLLSREKVASAVHVVGTTKKGKKGQPQIKVFGDRGSTRGSTTLLDNPSSNLLSRASRLRIFKLMSNLLEILLDITPPGSSLQVSSHSISDILGGGKVFGALMSILMETWVEGHPRDVFGKDHHVQFLGLLESVVNMVCVYLRLMLQLNEEGDMEVLVTDCCERIATDVSSFVFHYFPFAMVATSVPNHHKYLYVMNFTFCEVSLLLWKLLSPVKAEMAEALTLAAFKYLGKLSSDDIAASVHDPMCSRIVVRLVPLLYPISLTHDQLGSVAAALASIKNFYFACHPHSRTRRLLVQCFGAMLVKELECGECK
jgi:hypothetical protein